MDDGRILILEPEEQLSSAITSALNEAAPGAQVDLARTLEQAQALVLEAKPDLFVLDLDAAPEAGQDFLYDLRTSHPEARAIILTTAHVATQREQVAGLCAIHFLEKPFPHQDFVELVPALLRPAGAGEEKFRGTLSDLHIADIIQLKCMSGSTSVLEFTGPRGEKARVFLDRGKVQHAIAPGKEGLAAFNEIVTWKGGTISEVHGAGPAPRTINQDWQMVLMDAVRESDERQAAASAHVFQPKQSSTRKVLVIDDSLMLLRFVEEILGESNYRVFSAANATEGLTAAKANLPDLILLDYVLPDFKGDEVSRRLLEDPATADIPVLFMSGFGADLRPQQSDHPNVIGFLNKPFTSDLLIKTVEAHMPQSPGEPESTPSELAPAQAEEAAQPEAASVFQGEPEAEIQEEPEAEIPQAAAASDEWWNPPAASQDWSAEESDSAPQPAPAGRVEHVSQIPPTANESGAASAFFCGDTSFFSLHWALRTIAKERLTGFFRAYWDRAPVELLGRDGEIVLATTRDPELYCPDAPVTLVSVDAGRLAAARADQTQTGCPLFLTLAREDLILDDPALQLVQHYGQKLFAQLWTGQRVRLVFEQTAELPAYAGEVSPEPDVDHWALGCLRFIQFQDLGTLANYDPASIPAYTKDGFERVQDLKLTVAEAQFASQFNGARSIAQIAKNLRLDLKFARLTLFRFIALEIVECWPPPTAAKPESKGIFQRFSRSLGRGE
jgi:DNA-binding response OmpR family regulator